MTRSVWRPARIDFAGMLTRKFLRVVRRTVRPSTVTTTRRSLDASRIATRAVNALRRHPDARTPPTLTTGARRSARAAGAAEIVVSWDALLFALFGSGWPPETDAVFVIFPASVGRITIVTVAEAPLARSPKAQVTVVVPEQLP